MSKPGFTSFSEAAEAVSLAKAKGEGRGGGQAIRNIGKLFT